MNRLKAYMATKCEEVDKALERYLPRLTEKPSSLHEAMRYSVFAGGKRLRPALTIMSADIFGVNTKDAMPCACAIEMIHTYSLIHDDLPAMDDDDYRRGRLSCHKAFGEAIAILAGDALLTMAFEIIPKYSPRQYAADLALVLAKAAGSAGMVGGQVLDMVAEGEVASPSDSGREIDPDTTPMMKVEAIHERKTGALLTAAVQMGAVLGEANEEDMDALITYGEKIGLAFQIKDDILDIESTSEKMGKTVGKDEATGKLTYPALLGMDESKELMKDTVSEAKQAIEKFDEKAFMLRLLADYIAERDH